MPSSTRSTARICGTGMEQRTWGPRNTTIHCTHTPCPGTGHGVGVTGSTHLPLRGLGVGQGLAAEPEIPFLEGKAGQQGGPPRRACVQVPLLDGGRGAKKSRQHWPLACCSRGTDGQGGSSVTSSATASPSPRLPVPSHPGSICMAPSGSPSPGMLPGCRGQQGWCHPSVLGTGMAGSSTSGAPRAPPCACSPSALSTATRPSRKALTRVTLGSRTACSGAIHGSLPCPGCSPRLPMLCSACPMWGRAHAAVPPTAAPLNPMGLGIGGGNGKVEQPRG